MPEAAATALAADATAGTASRRTLATDVGLHCDASVDDASTLRALLEPGGALAGSTLHLPSGCVVLLGSPGAGRAVADLAPFTGIECADATAGFAFARQHCTSGDLIGAACTSHAHCPDGDGNGTCGFQGNATSSFAPDANATYTGFRASRGVGQRFAGCSIWVNQAQGLPVNQGGNGREVGVCRGGTRDGASCYQTCDAASGPKFAGKTCNASGAADCGGGSGSCQLRSSCAAAGGTCASVDYDVDRGGSGPGNIHPLDWTGSRDGTIRDVTIYDHRKGDFHVATGFASTVADLDTGGDAVPVTDFVAGKAFGGYATRRRVRRGLVANPLTRATRVDTAGWSVGIEAWGDTTISASRAGGYGDPNVPGWDGAVAFDPAGGRIVLRDVTCGDGVLYGVRPSGFNFLVDGLMCDGSSARVLGPRIVIENAGNQYSRLRLAWTSRGAVVAFGDLRGRCTGGARDGRVCVFGAGDDELLGCPGASCAAHRDFPAKGANHASITSSLIHSERDGIAFVRTPDALRCDRGPDQGRPCAADADCAGGAMCRPLQFVNVLISGNEFYGGNGTAFELDTSAVNEIHRGSGVLTNVGGPTLAGWEVSSNYYVGFATTFSFPAEARRCATSDGGGSAGQPCRGDADCSGADARCVGQVADFVVAGNAGASKTPLRNWSWNYGDASGLTGLPPGSDEGTIVTLVAGENVERGDLLSVATTAEDTVVRSAPGQRTIGVALASIGSGERVKVLTAGTAGCAIDGEVAAGDALRASASAAGRASKASADDASVVGVALSPGASGSVVRCMIGPR